MKQHDERTAIGAPIHGSGGDYPGKKTETGSAGAPCRIPILPSSRTRWNDLRAMWRLGDFYKCLPPQAMSEFESLAAPFRCEVGTVLLTEGEQPGRVLFLLDGQVRLSINSAGGRRLVLGIAEPGEILGLVAAVSGCRSEITAEAQFPCCVASLLRQSFLDLLLRYPIASYSIGRQLGMEYKRACDELRMVSSSATASIKLARLLVEWCAGGTETERGVRIPCSLTHEEIGEYIGVARETVSRTLTDFKKRELVQQHGSTMFVTSLRALEVLAGRADC